MDSPEAAKRKPLRLRDYNYDSAGYYFITICTEGKRHLLGHIVGAGVPDGPQMSLSPAGKIVDAQIKEMASHYDNIDVPKYVLMPNHIHLIIVVTGHGTSRTPSPTNSTIPAFISTLKRFTNKKHGIPLWQRGYYDHIIRCEDDYLRIWEYIDTNPVKWTEDKYFSD